MAEHQNPCELCDFIHQCESGAHPGVIAELETGWAVLGNSQFFRGYSLLLCKTPATELDELAPQVRAKFLEEMALLAQAVRAVVKPHKMNYECLGNLVHHLHWHIFPRYESEASPEKPVWMTMPQGDDAAPFALDAERDAPLIEAIRAELHALRHA